MRKGTGRVLIVSRGGPAAPSLRVPVPLVLDRQAATQVLRAMALGMIDAYLPAPGAGRDEAFRGHGLPQAADGRGGILLRRGGAPGGRQGRRAR